MSYTIQNKYSIDGKDKARIEVCYNSELTKRFSIYQYDSDGVLVAQILTNAEEAKDLVEILTKIIADITAE